MRRLVTSSLTILAMSAILATAACSGTPTGNTITPVWSIAGGHSAIAEREYHLIRDQETLNALWERHKGEGLETDTQGWAVVPEVDFDRYMVLAIFRGDAVNCRKEVIESIDEMTTGLRVRWDASTFQTASFGEPEEGDLPGGAVRSRTYGFWVLPASNGVVTLEENVQGLINQPPKWKTQHVFRGRG